MFNLGDYGKPLLRISMALVFLYFGFQQITSPDVWVGYVPDFALVFGLTAKNIVLMNSILELALGLLLIIGFYTRTVSLILSLHLFVIAFSLGFNELGVRDFGLALATLSVFFNGHDWLSLDRRFSNELYY